jgi:hypothetical protein
MRHTTFALAATVALSCGLLACQATTSLTVPPSTIDGINQFITSFQTEAEGLASGLLNLIATDPQKAACNESESAVAELLEFEKASVSLAATLTVDPAAFPPAPTPSPSPAPVPPGNTTTVGNKTVTANADGTITVTITQTRTTPGGVNVVEVCSRTFRRADQQNVRVQHTRTFRAPSGLTRVQSRLTTWAADGSYTVVTRIDVTLPNGKTRTTQDTATFRADGTSSSVGSIRRYDGTDVTCNRTKAAGNGPTTVTCVDPKAQLEMTEAYDDQGSKSDVDVKANGKAAGKVKRPSVDS